MGHGEGEGTGAQKWEGRSWGGGGELISLIPPYILLWSSLALV